MRGLCRAQVRALLAGESTVALTVDDTAVLASLHYPAELRNLVTLCRLIIAWQMDPATKPLLDVLLSSQRPAGGGTQPLLSQLPSVAVPPVPVAGAVPPGSAETSANQPVGAVSGEAAGSPEPVCSSGAAAVADTAETEKQPAHDPRKLMLAQLIADQVTERREGVAAVRELANSVEAMLTESERSGSLNERVSAMAKTLADIKVLALPRLLRLCPSRDGDTVVKCSSQSD